MLDTELNYEQPEGLESTVLEPVPGFVREDATDDEMPETVVDAESVLSHDLAATELLTREEELALSRELKQARRRVLRILRGRRRLTKAALASGGRGLVPPETDFREREAILIWQYARKLINDRPAAKRLGLTVPELRNWIAEYGEALAEYRELRDQMVQANLRLVSVLARRYRHPTLTYLDLFQEGVLGLLRAVEKYDPERKVRFATYATWWIWQQLGRSVDTYGPLIRTPVHWSQLRRRMRREGDHPSSESEEPGEDSEPVSAVEMQRLDTIARGFQYVSTDAPLGEDDDRALGALLASDEAEPDAQVGNAVLREQLNQILADLPQREQLIVRQRFGLGDDQTRTLEEIGQELGVSRERIRQLEARALHLLKEECEARGLRDHLH
jgi:RNA polymerase sigma factor (sigma-70 family)